MKSNKILFLMLCCLMSISSITFAQSRMIYQTTIGSTKSSEAQAMEGFFKDVNYAFYLFGQGADYHRTQEQINKAFATQSFLFGAQKNRFGLYYEGNRFEEKTSAGGLSIERRNNSHMAWGDYDVLTLRSQNKMFKAAGFIGLGVGMTLDTINTKFLEEDQKDQSEYQWKAGAQIGVALQASVVGLRLEGQVLTGANRNPNPGYAGFARIGLVF